MKKYFVVKHFMTIDDYSIREVVNDLTDAVALRDIYNRNEDRDNIEYIVTESI